MSGEEKVVGPCKRGR